MAQINFRIQICIVQFAFFLFRGDLDYVHQRAYLHRCLLLLLLLVGLELGLAQVDLSEVARVWPEAIGYVDGI